MAPGAAPGASKTAGWFPGSNALRALTQQSGDMAAQIARVKGEMDGLLGKLRFAQTKMRNMMNQGSPLSGSKERLEETMRDLQTRIDDCKEQLLTMGVSRGEIEQQRQNIGTGVSAAVGLPTLFAGAYGTEAWNNQ